MNSQVTRVAFVMLLIAAVLVSPALPIVIPAVADETPKVIWYGTLKDGLAEAKRSDRPILLISAAPHCHAVSGVW